MHEVIEKKNLIKKSKIEELQWYRRWKHMETKWKATAVNEDISTDQKAPDWALKG